MNNYESLILLADSLAEPEQKKFIDQIKDLIEKNKGNLKDSVSWGKKTLAFQIGESKSGFYWLLNFEGNETLPKKLTDFLRIEDSVLRFLIEKAIVSSKPKKKVKKVEHPRKKLVETFIR